MGAAGIGILTGPGPPATGICYDAALVGKEVGSIYKVVVSQFGGPQQLRIVEEPTPEPGPGQVRVRLTSIGMNHAELMQRRGAYRHSSGEPPFTPGLEGGGVIEAVGEGVRDRPVGQRVILSLDAPRRARGGDGTYRSHCVVDAPRALPVPEGVDDRLLGAVWLAYLTAWGCLIWRQQLQPSQAVLIPAASSAVAIAASQIVQEFGGVAIGTTRSEAKAERLARMEEARYHHLVVSGAPDWVEQVRALTDGHGCGVIFDPIAAGPMLDDHIRLLAPRGTIWLYGLLGRPGVVNVARLILKRATIRGWLNDELLDEGRDVLPHAGEQLLQRVADGRYRLPVAGTFPLRRVADAHAAMERGEHIGKLILVP